MSDEQVRGLDSIIGFGVKHRGERLDQVIAEDPAWVQWVTEEAEMFVLDVEAERMLRASLK